MRGNEKDCICAKPDGKHEEYCDAFRLSEFLKKAVGVLSEEEEGEITMTNCTGCEHDKEVWPDECQSCSRAELHDNYEPVACEHKWRPPKPELPKKWDVKLEDKNINITLRINALIDYLASKPWRNDVN